jgi:hypothetical protein
MNMGVGWFLVAFFLIGGIAFTIALPWVGIGQIWIAVAVVLGLVYLMISRRQSRMESLRQTGLPGQAQILEMTQTGVYINENPQVKMKLNVQAQGIAPCVCEKKATVPLIALGMLGSGRPLSVFVNPNDHEDIYIDWSGAPAGDGAVAAGAGPFTFAFPDGSSVDLSTTPRRSRRSSTYCARRATTRSGGRSTCARAPTRARRCSTSSRGAATGCRSRRGTATASAPGRPRRRRARSTRARASTGWSSSSR